MTCCKTINVKGLVFNARTETGFALDHDKNPDWIQKDKLPKEFGLTFKFSIKTKHNKS
jgi:hypothetical protein